MATGLCRGAPQDGRAWHKVPRGAGRKRPSNGEVARGATACHGVPSARKAASGPANKWQRAAQRGTKCHRGRRLAIAAQVNAPRPPCVANPTKAAAWPAQPDHRRFQSKDRLAQHPRHEYIATPKRPAGSGAAPRPPDAQSAHLAALPASTLTHLSRKRLRLGANLEAENV